ncbi:hypothetical protein PPL_03868 [Heterostelium album PN500]|uniref:Ankyrin repeat protein n=1 Tax=Heterostelium pallidum (strain ATCC 26659 / Pp 5 / PN500) TaxID=670386 RepID=D3B5D2_HETP5|nr:hypothetical protein PPL_03868 [Heterostelium album PN500]EFA83080.1 hypothetical protein PPL_03868 [Heterostelium album PN500]|eukprot:XP_020435197.1 hypothetical protein PPL_03868 [Heterostelium album PN500]
MNNSNNNKIDLLFRCIFNNIILNRKIISFIHVNNKYNLKYNEVLQSSKELIYHGYLNQLIQLIESYESRQFIGIYTVYIEPYLKFTTRHLNIFLYIYQKFFVINNNDKSIFSDQQILSDRTIIYATNNNNLQVLKYLLENIFIIKKNNNINISSNNNNILVDENTILSIKKKIELSLITAITNGYINIVRYLYEDGFIAECNIDRKEISLAVDKACANGYLEVLTFIFENERDSFDTHMIISLLDVVSSNNHINIVHFLFDIVIKDKQNNYYISAKTFQAICKYGHLDMFKQLIQYHRSINGNMSLGSLIDSAALHGHLDVIQFISQQTDIVQSCSSDALDKASENGWIDVVQWLHQNKTQGCTNNAMTSAAANGFLDVVIYLHENRTEGIKISAMERAALHGNLDVVKFIHFQRKEGGNASAMKSAAHCGHLPTVQFLQQERSFEENRPFEAFQEAVKTGHFEVAKYLYDHNHQLFPQDQVYLALFSPNYDIVKYLFIEKNLSLAELRVFQVKKLAEHTTIDHLRLIRNQMPHMFKPDLIDYAAKNGHIEMTKYLLDCFNGAKFSNALCKALSNDHFVMVEYLISQCDYGPSLQIDLVGIINHAVRTKKLALVDRLIRRLLEANLVKQRYVLNYLEPYVDNLIREGHLWAFILLLNHKVITTLSRTLLDKILRCKHYHLVKFFRINLPHICTESTLTAAVGNFEILKYIFYEYRDRVSFNYTNVLREAINVGSTDIVKFLHDYNDGYNVIFKKECMDYAAELGRLDIIKFLHENRTEGCSTKAMDLASMNGHLDTVKFLHANRTEGCTNKAVDNASVYGHFEILKFLHANRTEGWTFVAYTVPSSRIPSQWIKDNLYPK